MTTVVWFHSCVKRRRCFDGLCFFVQLASDYPVLGRNCLPELATVLAKAQAKELRATIDASMPFSLTFPMTGSDIFLFAGKQVNGRPAYRGLHRRLWMYHCDHDNLWALGVEDSIGSALQNPGNSGCNGNSTVWVDLETVSAWTAQTGQSTRISGIHVDVGIGHCNAFLASQNDTLTSLAMTPPDADTSEQPEIVSFARCMYATLAIFCAFESRSGQCYRSAACKGGQSRACL